MNMSQYSTQLLKKKIEKYLENLKKNHLIRSTKEGITEIKTLRNKASKDNFGITNFII